MPTMKTWSKPELIVLVRGKPEEAVLETCKGDGNWTGANSADGDCQIWQPVVACVACRGAAAS